MIDYDGYIVVNDVSIVDCKLRWKHHSLRWIHHSTYDGYIVVYDEYIDHGTKTKYNGYITLNTNTSFAL